MTNEESYNLIIKWLSMEDLLTTSSIEHTPAVVDDSSDEYKYTKQEIIIRGFLDDLKTLIKIRVKYEEGPYYYGGGRDTPTSKDVTDIFLQVDNWFRDINPFKIEGRGKHILLLIEKECDRRRIENANKNRQKEREIEEKIVFNISKSKSSKFTFGFFISSFITIPFSLTSSRSSLIVLAHRSEISTLYPFFNFCIIANETGPPPINFPSILKSSFNFIIFREIIVVGEGNINLIAFSTFFSVSKYKMS